MPLHIAVNSYTDAQLFETVLLLLLEGGADLNARAFTSLETPLFRAVGEGQFRRKTGGVERGGGTGLRKGQVGLVWGETGWG